MTLREILQEKIDLLDSGPNTFSESVLKSQKQIFNQILDKLEGLDIDSKGVVLPTNNNLAMIKELGKELKLIIQNPENAYMKAVAEFTNDMFKAQDISNVFYETFSDEFTPQKSFDTLYKNAVNTGKNLVANSAVSENVTAFEDMLQTAIGSGDSYNNIVKNISTLIQGNDKIEGGLHRYAKQNAKDIFAVADRQYSNAIATDLGIQFYEYAGGEIETTRPFCDERNGEIFHEKEIADWGAGKKTPGMSWPQGGTWAGRAAGTNDKTIFTLLGGYNCDHVLIPVALRHVPVDVLERNIASGNIDYDDLPEEIQAKLD